MSVAIRERAWDLPVRLFHWTVVLLVAFSWWSAHERLLDWHRRSGYIILALVSFRLLWGVFGSTTARFSSFVRGPREVLAYARVELFRRDVAGFPGHNPLGGWGVIAMLLALLTQVLLGMFAVDVDGIESGPLSSRVNFITGRLASKMHGMLFNGLLTLIALHVAAVLFYLFYKRTNLITPMLSGWRSGAASHGLRHGSLMRAFLLLMLSAAATWAIVTHGG